MGKTIFIVLSAALLIVSFSFGGGQAKNAHVKGVFCGKDDQCGAIFDVNFINKPACANATGSDGRRFQFNGATTFGKSMLAILLSAQATQAQVYADGAGTCTFPGVEDLNQIFIWPDPL